MTKGGPLKDPAQWPRPRPVTRKNPGQLDRRTDGPGPARRTDGGWTRTIIDPGPANGPAQAQPRRTQWPNDGRRWQRTVNWTQTRDRPGRTQASPDPAQPRWPRPSWDGRRTAQAQTDWRTIGQWKLKAEGGHWPSPGPVKTDNDRPDPVTQAQTVLSPDPMTQWRMTRPDGPVCEGPNDPEPSPVDPDPDETVVWSSQPKRTQLAQLKWPRPANDGNWNGPLNPVLASGPSEPMVIDDPIDSWQLMTDERRSQ